MGQHSLPQTSAVEFEGKQYECSREGLADILVPKTDGAKLLKQEVFFNPVQQFNRDLSVLAIKCHAEDLLIRRKATLEERQRRRAETTGRGSKGKQDAKANGTDVQSHKRKRESENDCVNEESLAKKLKTGPSGVSKPFDHERNRIESVDLASTDASYPSNAPGKAEGQSATGCDDELTFQDPPETVSGNQAVTIQDKDPRKSIPTGPDLDQQTHAKRQTDNKTTPEGSKIHYRVLDALSATGLRALRYAKEIPEVTYVTANDISVSATRAIATNAHFNQVNEKVYANTGDALVHMSKVGSEASPKLPDGSHGKYEVVDLDPYGTAATFLEPAIRSLSDGGLLCVTCTDSGVFASTGYVEKAFSLYSGTSLKGPQSHEGGIRLILNACAVAAARHGIAIEPLLSLSIDFYVRIFLRIHKSPAQVKLLASKTIIVYNCDEGCGAWSTQPLARTQSKLGKNNEPFFKFGLAKAPSASQRCEHCGFKTHLSVPMWGGPIHNPYFVQKMIAKLPHLDPEVYGTVPRLEGMLYGALHETLCGPEEAPNTPPSPSSTSATPTDSSTPSPPSTYDSTDPSKLDPVPFFFIPSALAGVIHCQSIPEAALRGALLHLGYRVTRSHAKPGSVRTNAPWSVIWEIMREWVRQKCPIKEGMIREGTAGWGIMQNDRSNVRLRMLKEGLRKALETGKDFERVKSDVEATLYRVEKLEGEATAKEVANREENNGEIPGQVSEDSGGKQTVDPSDPLKISQMKIVFDEKLGKSPDKKKMVRYQENPRANWGPMARARGE